MRRILLTLCMCMFALTGCSAFSFTQVPVVSNPVAKAELAQLSRLSNSSTFDRGEDVVFEIGLKVPHNGYTSEIKTVETLRSAWCFFGSCMMDAEKQVFVFLNITKKEDVKDPVETTISERVNIKIPKDYKYQKAFVTVVSKHFSENYELTYKKTEWPIASENSVETK